MELEELVQSVDIVDYISQYVDLQERNGEYWGLSPFKDEKTPSFSVREDPPFFYDFSSGKGGNLIDFIKYYKHCSSSEAVNEIEKYLGLDGGQIQRGNKLQAVRIIKKFKTTKNETKEQKAKPLPDNYMRKYTKDSNKLLAWTNEGISQEALDRFEVRYDEFSNRIVYPIRNMNGDIVNIGGRTLDPDWKEKELRKYCYFFQWGTMNTIYGAYENMSEILKKREVIIFEGCKSVLLADSWGIKNTAAILTSHLNPSQLKILVKIGCRVVFALDKDVDITKDKNIQKLRRYVNVEYVCDRQNLLMSKDSPVDRGKDVFITLYNERKRFA